MRTTQQSTTTNVLNHVPRNGRTKDPVTVVDHSSVQRTFWHYLAMFIWVGWTLFYLVLLFVLPLLWMYARTALSALAALMALSALCTIKRHKQPKWAMKLGRWLGQRGTEYFRTKMILEDKEAIENCGQAIFALEPHHVLPLSIVSFNEHTRGFGGHKSLGCITSICFKIPLMRHVYTWINAYSVDKKDLVWMLDKGISPVLCPGGVQEVTYMESDDECVLYLKKRAGFIKLALQYGIPVIPAFTFGLQHTFSYWIPRNKFCFWLGRKFGALPMLFFGVFGLPLGPAKPCDYVNVVGTPIAMPKIATPTDAEIKHYQALFIAEMERIFHTYKEKHGMGHIKLRII